MNRSPRWEKIFVKCICICIYDKELTFHKHLQINEKRQMSQLKMKFYNISFQIIKYVEGLPFGTAAEVFVITESHGGHLVQALALLLTQLPPMHTLGRQQVTKCLSPWNPNRRSRLSHWLLTSACSLPWLTVADIWGNEPVNGKSFFFCFSYK